jgi:hypothetical protein
LITVAGCRSTVTVGWDDPKAEPAMVSCTGSIVKSADTLVMLGFAAVGAGCAIRLAGTVRIQAAKQAANRVEVCFIVMVISLCF